MAVNIHITIIELNALHTKRQNLFQELDAVIHLLMEAFFFQAKDGIRAYKVTGVQTCALPICVPLNIAEGSAKRGSREYRRYLDTARGSLAEVETMLGMAHSLGYLRPAEFGRLEALATETRSEERRVGKGR